MSGSLPIIHSRWTGAVHSFAAGLRGTGQCVRPNLLTHHPSDECGYNTEDVLFDCVFDSAIGSDELIVRRRVLSTWWMSLRRSSAGLLYFENGATGQQWFSTRTFTSGVVRKIEMLSYHGPQINGSHTGHLQVWCEGELWLDLMNVDITGYNWGQTQWDSLNSTSFRIGDYALYYGMGGWTDADVLSDTAGNPRVLPLYVNGAGSHSDGTPTGAATPWEAVDEQPTSDTGTFSTLLAANPDSSDSYAMESLPGTVTRALGLTGLYYTKTSSGVNFSQPLFLRINPAANEYAEGDSVEPDNDLYSPQSTFTGYAQGMWRKSPATGRELAVAEINGCELGWRPAAFTTSTSVSHVYAEVLCYVSPPATPTLPVAQKSIIIHKTHHLCRLWKLEPRWGMPMYFTDHVTPIAYKNRTYEPAGGISSTDVRRELGLKDANVDLSGSITSAKITVDDLRAGRYKQARLTEYVVDWRYPWAGPLITRPWTIEPDEIDGEVWKATASGIQQRLLDRAGDSYYPRCRFSLFDDDYPVATTKQTWERGCKLDSFGWQNFGTVGTVTDRRVFQISAVVGTTDYYAGGLLVFMRATDARLTNCVGQIKSNAAGLFSLHLPMPYDVTLLDQVMIWPGCNFLIGTVNAGDCEDKFDNVQNFGGFMLIPGTDEATRGAKS